MFPTNNEWGIPTLNVDLQATNLVAPALIWGGYGTSRTSRVSGTWLFYTEDYRMEALWKDPTPVLNSQCHAAAEPNFSCYEDMPMAFGLYQIYRKRWIARFWQSKGLPVIVDLNVSPKFYEFNMLGVPQGWRAYSTRGYTGRIDALDAEYDMAVNRAGTNDVLFIVYGGGKAVRAKCLERSWSWLPEMRTLMHGREV